MILLIDNYDSFSYNLYQLIAQVYQQVSKKNLIDEELQKEIVVLRNDEKTVEEIREMNPQAIFLSPGPGKPQDAGICMDVVKKLYQEIPILGVCLGHQAICEAFGELEQEKRMKEQQKWKEGQAHQERETVVSYAPQLMHGKTSLAQLDHRSVIFRKMKPEIQIARYHSLIAMEERLPGCLKVTARTKAREIMAVEHEQYPVYGLQFHPESILTPDGYQIMKNFMEEIEND